LIKLVFASALVMPVAFGQIALTTAQIAKRVSPSVVVIKGKTDSGEIQGSGFIISKDGKIVTNFHVIKDLNTAEIQLPNGEVFDSLSVLAVDERRDLAIVKVAGFNLSTLQLGNSDVLSVGERVVVVGSPLGLEATVTAGILSAKRDSGKGFKVLQTDAAVNHGNSGGPLVGASGLAVGVVSSILRSDSAQGINFAIPINYVRGLLDNLDDPMTLEQMRQKFVSTKSADQQGSGASLKETLDWLKENIPLASNHYVWPPRSWAIEMGTNTVSERTLPIRFDSCTVSYDRITVETWAKYRDSPIVKTVRQTIPLGSLTGGKVDHPGALDAENMLGQKVDTWFVVLDATSKVILSEAHEDSNNTTKSESMDYAFLVFYEESITNRVLEAFKHAAALCKGKAPF
jgi:hypothetical protein